MIRRTIAAAACAAAFALGCPAAAQQVENRAIEKKHLDSGKVTLDRSKAYIYITGPMRTTGIFIKTADAEELALYEAEWKEELADEQKKYERRLKSWERYQKMGRAAGEKPIEPTPENFSIGSLDQRLMVSYGPQYIYDKDEDGEGEKSFSYLIETEPGNYAYYGPMFYVPGTPAGGLCYCMGSVRFEAPAGQVTSLGDLLAFQWVDTAAARQASVAPIVERSANEAIPVDYSVPPELAEFGAAPADLRAAGKMNNFFGAMIGRMPPLAGVLAYDRDTPIDVKGLAERQATEAASDTHGEAAAEAGEPAGEAIEQAGEAVAEQAAEPGADSPDL